MNWLDDQRPAMVDLLGKIVNIDSGSYDHAGVDAVGEAIRAHLDERGMVTEIIPRPDASFCLTASIEAHHDDPRDSHILLMGHRDTVFPAGEAAKRPFRIKDDRAFGPGVADMKCGLVMNSFVAEAFHRFGGNRHPIRVLYTSDEEIGSPSSRAVIEAQAEGARAVLNSEPGRPSGNVVIGRKGALFMTLEISGIAAHSGSAHEKGASAIEALCRKVQTLHALTDYKDGRTVNIGLIEGGQSANTVAPFAKATIDIRYKTRTQLAAIEALVGEIVDRPEIEGTKARIARRTLFPPLEQTAVNRTLFERYVEASAGLGLNVAGEFSGGAADSGFTSAIGVPTICAVGPLGEKGHQTDEAAHLETFVPRAKAMAATIFHLNQAN
ncbi:MAG: M20 family metallopeptidase [Geminicoccaceae bacterium]